MVKHDYYKFHKLLIIKLADQVREIKDTEGAS